MRRVREQHGVDRRQLADRIGRHISSIQRWEYGHKTPLLGTIGEIADALGVDYTELITRTDKAGGVE
ncbi:XRE family transcriptional regulator [Halostreptopolyspora alba]|uniref:XRE family transcriptional regulator n=2 Tax=Halostreptopolyspora alba TaxID=2487137 RepID=A0A3N0EAB3_9ACTN|nr:XRE family transcriptional regulator [Nocardiopsaceae bacterium YIM 96095]